MSTPSIPGVHRDDLADAIQRATDDWLTAYHAADAALAYIAAHQEPRACDCGSKYDRRPDCTADDAYEEGRKDACDREHADEWVEVDEATWEDLSDGVRVRQEWEKGCWVETLRRFVHRAGLPDPDEVPVERMARAIFASDCPFSEWEIWDEAVHDRYRRAARAALAAHREGER